jgi:hypothetical protein
MTMVMLCTGWAQHAKWVILTCQVRRPGCQVVLWDGHGGVSTAANPIHLGNTDMGAALPMSGVLISAYLAKALHRGTQMRRHGRSCPLRISGAQRIDNLGVLPDTFQGIAV